MKINNSFLAPYAAKAEFSLGRENKEPRHPYRSDYQRDRERIIHSRAFRRLEYKTQVFINHEGDHYRTRLTHTIEVAQIARSIARALNLNEDLTESIALAHDLGHTPFGHAGEKTLDKILKDLGGFEHNRQSLRVVEFLEERYHDFKGLNLTWETREGIIKHSSPYDRPELSNYKPEEQPTLEAQIIDLADEIAYNNHDLDDGFSSKILNFKKLKKLKIWHLAEKSSQAENIKDEKIKLYQIIRSIINLQVTDLISGTKMKLKKFKIKNYFDVKKNKTKLIGFNPEIEEANEELKIFLKEELYKHYRVARMTVKAHKVITELFRVYLDHPDTLPEGYQTKIKKEGKAQTVTDYIAGMTDRYALNEYQKLTDPIIHV
jgi:dGTPase